MRRPEVSRRSVQIRRLIWEIARNGQEGLKMNNENRNDEAVSPVIATILMVAITVVLAGVLYVWASSLAEGNTDGDIAFTSSTPKTRAATSPPAPKTTWSASP